MTHPIPTADQVGQIIRALREAHGHSQSAIADQANISRYYYSSIELGERNPTLLVLAQIAHALGITLSELIAQAEQLT